MLTSHGYRSVELHGSEWGGWPPDLIADAVTRLYTDGHKFFGGYGKALSVAQSTPDWGEAFFTPEWLADHACRPRRSSSSTQAASKTTTISTFWSAVTEPQAGPGPR